MSLPDLKALTPIHTPHPHQPGQAVMIECFATWCPPCRGQIPHIATLPAKFPNVHIVAVSSEDAETVGNFAKKMPPMAKYNVAVDPSGETQKLMESTSTQGIPAAFIFDKEGKLAWHGHPGDAECEVTLGSLN